MVCLFFTTEEYSCEYGSLKFYALCGFGGVLSCGLTHTAVVPLDLVKCRIQVCILPNFRILTFFWNKILNSIRTLLLILINVIKAH